jgi:pimeloyl-ACP methyl ester carboxylesterase
VSDLYLDPVAYGIQDVAVPPQRAVRIMFPSEAGNVFGASVRPGTYPLVVFVHGYRNASDGLCPTDITQDYRAWVSVLHLLARCGFVVAAPDVHDVVADSAVTTEVVEDVIRWMHFQWEHRAVLWGPSAFVDPDRYRQRADATPDLSAFHMSSLGVGIGVDPTAPGGITTSVGLAGHSWGARACALVAARRNVRVDAVASVAGSWDDNSAVSAFYGVRPTLMIAGTADGMNAGYLAGFWDGLGAPKHQALLMGIGHWDWFSNTSGLHPCDPDVDRPLCGVGWLTAAELLLTFFVKHLLNQWTLPSHLVGPSGSRTALLPYYQNTDRCGLRVRWHDPLASGPSIGHATFGHWQDSDYPW